MARSASVKWRPSAARWVFVGKSSWCQVQNLHDSLQWSSGGLTRAEVVGRQLSREVQKLRQRFAAQERVLGAFGALECSSHCAQRSCAGSL